ncbi:hypothetical protein HPB48_026421 [Haemaphysalis longicornis]|uniref:Uncharacterized protein n=1 Tax=Haemaphysalis longicornis TaxID=44386 RepID=A0A9J6HCA8_HAELO|nr:hypothetical protein HPB48_026421 [Haemaphysalis longicornis]
MTHGFVPLHYHTGSGVWKVHYHSSDPKQCAYVCHCYGSYVLDHDPPLIYNLVSDPSESRSLTPADDPRVPKVLEAVNAALTKHRASLSPVPQQFDLLNSLWLPWLQPCCSFPLCSCKENYTLRVL